MHEIVRFLMINLKNSESDFDFENDINTLLEQTKIKLNASDLKFNSNDTRTRKYSITIDVNTFYISFTYLRLNTTSQLKVDISGENYTHFDANLHHLKTQLKDLLLDKWEQCLWLQDIQAEEYSDLLYKDVHTVENALRRLINTILFYNLGGGWWEKYMPTNLVERYKDRDEQYKQRSRSFKNIHTNLMSIDTADLIQILNFKTYKIKEVNLFSSHDINNSDIQKFQYIMSDILNGEKIEWQKLKSHKDNLTDILKDVLAIDKDFGKDFFAPWFSCDLREFIGKWNGFCNDRNHVAHNKLIDVKLFNKYMKSMKELRELIEEAEKKFNNHLHSEMDQYLEKLEAQAEQEAQTEQEEMRLFKEHEISLHQSRKISEEAGVEIKEDEEIIEMFKEIVSDTFFSIHETLYHRSDIKLFLEEPKLVENETVLKIIHTYLDCTIRVDLEAQTDSSQSGESTLELKLYKDDIKKKTFNITYTNGSAYFDNEQGTYLPSNEAELDLSEIYELETDIYTFIELEMPEINEEEIASFPCTQCDKYTINLSKNNGCDIGTCLYCKHPNHVGKCMMCAEIVDSPTDDIICSNCRLN